MYREMALNCDVSTHKEEVAHKPVQEVISTGSLLLQPLLTRIVLFFWTLHLLSSVPGRNKNDQSERKHPVLTETVILVTFVLPEFTLCS